MQWHHLQVPFTKTPSPPPSPHHKGKSTIVIIAASSLASVVCRASPSPPASNSQSGGQTSRIESAGSGLQPMSTKDGIIYGVDGGTLELKGVAWYGFDNGTTLNGLTVAPLPPPPFSPSLSLSTAPIPRVACQFQPGELCKEEQKYQKKLEGVEGVQ